MYTELFNSATPADQVNTLSICYMDRVNYRNVSQAAIKTRNPFWINQKQTFDKFVLFPTPLTPTNVILYGNRCCVEGRGDDNLVRIESNKSVDVLGVKIRVNEVDNACLTAALMASNIY